MEKRQINRSSQDLFIAVAGLALCTALFFSSCQDEGDGELARRMAELDAGGGAVLPAKIQEYQTEIALLEDEVETVISAVQQQGTFYELLGLKYLDYGMYGEALNSFDAAIDIFPDKPALYYYRGISEGRLAQGRNNTEEKNDLLINAETDYLYAVHLDERYSPPLYALAILYIYELDQPNRASNFLDRFLEIEPSHPQALVLRAQLYEEGGEYGKALDAYNSALQSSGDEEFRKSVEEKKNLLEASL